MNGKKQTYLEIFGAREHNLKNIDVKIPHGSLTVITGLSGSGKSSLAFDTIYAEGQRRYIETFSSYARNFMGEIERPDVDEILALSPVIAIDQQTTNRNPRSTVGTTTEIYDFLRLLYARIADAYSPFDNEKMVQYTEEEIVNLIASSYQDKKISILSPLVRARKGNYKELFENLRKKGFLNARVDGKEIEIKQNLSLDRYKNHDIELLIDSLLVSEKSLKRLTDSIHVALNQSLDDTICIFDIDTEELRYFSKNLMCKKTGISFSLPAPNNFSFNSPKGYCPYCQGTGYVMQVDKNKIIPDKKLSVYEGGIPLLGKWKTISVFMQIDALLNEAGYTIKTPLKDISDEVIDKIIYGSDDKLVVKSTVQGLSEYASSFMGVVEYALMQFEEKEGTEATKFKEQFSHTTVCPHCKGSRLNKEALQFRILDKNIDELAHMDIDVLYRFFDENFDKLSQKQQIIGAEIIKEIQKRLSFLINVGLNYISLSRATDSLSGGERQRIRLATQIGSQLVNVMYILDEPSIGLHPRDNVKLINSLKNLRDLGNTVIVVEHDEEMMLSADYIVDMGPLAGRKGGQVVFQGTVKDMLQTNTLTAQYINKQKKIEENTSPRPGNGHYLRLFGCTGNNLKNVDIDIPLGKFVCVTGVSGSGKSSLINGTLLPILSRHFYRSEKQPLPYNSIEGIEHIDKVISIDQSPIGRSPRSNPATYTGLFSHIRNLFIELPESKIRGYKAGRFSFNVKGGRCETCQGNGFERLEMGYMSDVYVKCKDCDGKRYNRETLSVKFKGKSIADVLDMTINQSVEFFENIPSILPKLKMLQEVGLGYIKLGQSSTTLSGGENQRVKLATELSKKDTGKTLYLLDEPTTGLHFEDINILLKVLNRLVDKSNTVLVIEHNLDVIRHADYLIDMGEEGGRNGGRVVCQGSVENVRKRQIGITSKYL